MNQGVFLKSPWSSLTYYCCRSMLFFFIFFGSSRNLEEVSLNFMSHGCVSSFYCLYFIAILMKWHLCALKQKIKVGIGFIYSTLGGVIQEIIINEGMNERYTKFHTFILLWVYLYFVYKTMSIYQLIDKEKWHFDGTCEKCLSYLANNISYSFFYLMMYIRILIKKKWKQFRVN